MCTCVSYILCCYMIACSVENNGDHQEVQEASHLHHQWADQKLEIISINKNPSHLEPTQAFSWLEPRWCHREYTLGLHTLAPPTSHLQPERMMVWLNGKATCHVWHVWPGCHHINWKLIQTDSDPNDYTVAISVAECSSSIGHHSWLNGLFTYFWCHWIFLISS